MSTFEVRWTPTYRALVKRSKSRLQGLILELGGEVPFGDKRTARELASEVMRLYRALPAESNSSGGP